MRGIPEWEATKGNGCNLTHPQAVQECADLSNQYRKRWRPMTADQVTLDKILTTLRAKKIPFVLTGAYGIGGWTGRPRATQDVDILVKPGRNLARAVNALKAAFPQQIGRAHV